MKNHGITLHLHHYSPSCHTVVKVDLSWAMVTSSMSMFLGRLAVCYGMPHFSKMYVTKSIQLGDWSVLLILWQSLLLSCVSLVLLRGVLILGVLQFFLLWYPKLFCECSSKCSIINVFFVVKLAMEDTITFSELVVFQPFHLLANSLHKSQICAYMGAVIEFRLCSLPFIW